MIPLLGNVLIPSRGMYGKRRKTSNKKHVSVARRHIVDVDDDDDESCTDESSTNSSSHGDINHTSTSESNQAANRSCQGCKEWNLICPLRRDPTAYPCALCVECDEACVIGKEEEFNVS